MARNKNKKQCTATSKRSGERCKRWAARGKNVCHYHGAGAGAPKGNRNAVTHGVYETITRERLTEQEQVVFDAITADPDLRHELRVLRFKLLRLLKPLERQVVVGTPDGAQVVTIVVDEISTAYAIAKLADGIRKLVKQLGSGEAEQRFEQLLAALMAPPSDARGDE